MKVQLTFIVLMLFIAVGCKNSSSYKTTNKKPISTPCKEEVIAMEKSGGIATRGIGEAMNEQGAEDIADINARGKLVEKLGSEIVTFSKKFSENSQVMKKAMAQTDFKNIIISYAKQYIKNYKQECYAMMYNSDNEMYYCYTAFSISSNDARELTANAVDHVMEKAGQRLDFEREQFEKEFEDYLKNRANGTFSN